MYLRKYVFFCLTFALLVGCQRPQDVAQPDAAWTSYESTNKTLRFEFPDGMRRTVQSTEPTAFLYENNTGDFGFSVLHGTGDPIDDDFASSMIAVSLEGATKVGAPQHIKLGLGKGLQQDYRVLDGYKFRVGRTIALTSRNDRLVFDVSYSERFEDELKPIYEKVLESLQFEDPPSTVTRNVSVGP